MMFLAGETIELSQIVYEDNHLIIINKKASEIVQGDKTGDMPLSEKVKNYIKQRDNKPGNVFCGVCHRLDRPVSGIVIFAKTSKALSRINELFRDKTIQKTYWAVVKNKPPHIIVNFAKTLVDKDYNVRNYLKIYQDLCKQYKIGNNKKPFDYILNYDQEEKIINVLDLLNCAIDFYCKKMN